MRDQFLQDIAWGPKRSVQTWPIYFVNGYKFHIEAWSHHKSTINCGVCIKGTDYGQSESDYYGILKEVIQLEYVGLPLKHAILFNCEWYDPTLNRGMRIHKQYGIVEIQTTRRYNKYDPFILAQQAVQVYYAPYPASREKVNWKAVIKTKARSTIDAPSTEVDNDAYQGDEIEEITPMSIDNDELPTLRDNEGTYEEVDRSFVNREVTEDEHEFTVHSTEEEDDLLTEDDTGDDDESHSDDLEDE